MQKAIHLYKQYKKEFSTLIDQDIKLNILSTHAELLLLLNKKTENHQVLNVHQALVELMNEVISCASLETKTKVFNAHLIGLKLNYEQGNILVAIEQLNRLLPWLERNVIPKEISFKTCIVAANLYLQPTSQKANLALIFLNIAQKNIVSLSENQQTLATIEILLMRLICEQQLTQTENAITTFNQLMELKAAIISPATLGTLLEKLLPLFNATDNPVFQTQISLLKIELEKTQAFIDANILLNILSVEASPQSASMPPPTNVPPVLLSYKYEKEEQQENNLSFLERIRKERSTKTNSCYKK